MKRFIALLCVLLLVFQIPVPAMAAAQPVLSSEALLSEDGSRITLTVTISGGKALCGGSFDIAFDDSLLKCSSLKAGDALAGSTFLGNADYSEGVARCGWIGIGGLSSDGTAAVAEFEVLPGAAGKKLSFELVEVNAYDTSGANVGISASGAELKLPGSPAPSVPDLGDREEPDDDDDQEAVLMEFTDVSKDAYYYEAVMWAVSKGITTGTSETTFSPRMVCTRGQAVTFLWRAAGCPVPKTTSCPFADVSPAAYYYTAVLWAVEKGITNGTSEGLFSPNMAVSRGQTVTFLWRAAGSPAVSQGASGFADVRPGSWYADAVSWALAKGVTTGTSETSFSPGALCTRSQIVTFLYRA